MKSKVEERIEWIDYMKLFACFLVVFGHLYMSLMVGGWLLEDAVYYCLPIQTIYTFHVPLFFVCSGFLYQYKIGDYTIKSHIKNIKNKILNLGIPYITFTIITLTLKNLFSDSVNNQATPFFKTIFLEPIAPYWYLYTLFFIFCIIPKQKNNKGLGVVLLISLIIKFVYVLFLWKIRLPDIIVKLANNIIWFSLGMLLANERYREKFLNVFLMVLCFVSGIILSVIFYQSICESYRVQFSISIMFVYAFVCMFAKMKKNLYRLSIVNLSQYFLPIYLLHTIVAATVRTILLRIGISSFGMHFLSELILSIVIPILIYEICKKKWWLLFWIEPKNAIKMKRKIECLSIND